MFGRKKQGYSVNCRISEVVFGLVSLDQKEFLQLAFLSIVMSKRTKI